MSKMQSKTSRRFWSHKSRQKGSGFGSSKHRSLTQSKKAKESSEDFLKTLQPGTLVVVTDGSCLGNPGRGGSGAVLYCDGKEISYAKKSFDYTTNNVAELTAVSIGLDLISIDDQKRQIVLLTDSKYVEGMLVKSWKAQANVELIEQIKTKLKQFPFLTMKWVPAHVGFFMNDRADMLANEARRGQQNEKQESKEVQMVCRRIELAFRNQKTLNPLEQMKIDVPEFFVLSKHDQQEVQNKLAKLGIAILGRCGDLSVVVNRYKF